jgi:CHASE3 domain sensor protein
VKHQNISQKPTQSDAEPEFWDGGISQSTSPVHEPGKPHVHLTGRTIQTLLLKSFSKKWSVERKTMAMLGLASVILVGLNLLFYWSFIKQKETSNRVNHSHKVLQELENVLSSVTEAETGQRGYLLTGQESYLEPYNLAVKTMGEQITVLQTLTVVDPQQQQQLSLLEPLIAKKFAELRETIDLRQNKGFEAANQVVLTHHGQVLMQRVRTVLQQMKSKEYEQLQTWLKAKQEEAQKIQLIFLFGIVFNLIAFYLVYRAIEQEIRERKQAEASLKQLNEQLEARVQKRTADLEEANTNLLYSNRELEQFA